MILLALRATAPSPLPRCQPTELSLAFDGEGGAFDGMSHSGTLLVLRNIGPRACSIAGLPTLIFKNAKGTPLPIARQTPPAMDPGPVIMPVGVAPGAELTTPLRWVAGPVYPQSRCYAVDLVSVAMGDATLQVAQRARVCGQAGRPATVEQPVLTRDPVL